MYVFQRIRKEEREKAIAREIMGVVRCRCWEQERKKVIEDIEKKEEEGKGWGFMEKAIEQMDKGLDILKWGLQIQKKAMKVLCEKEKKD